jgi:hypothetical protein
VRHGVRPRKFREESYQNVQPNAFEKKVAVQTLLSPLILFQLLAPSFGNMKQQGSENRR